MIPKIKITGIDSAQIPEEITDFSPIECMDCGYDGYIHQRFFAVEEVNNEKEYNKFCLLVKEKLGFESFGETGYDNVYLITVCRCPECGSENIFEDF